MGVRPGKNMGGWVVFFSSGPHTPVTFLDKYGGRDGSFENLKEDGIKKIRNEKIYKKILDEMAHLKQ